MSEQMSIKRESDEGSESERQDRHQRRKGRAEPLAADRKPPDMCVLSPRGWSDEGTKWEGKRLRS